MISQKDIALIEAFLQGTLSQEDRMAVEERIKVERDFAEHVRLVKDMAPAINTDVRGFRQDLNDIMQEASVNEKPKTRHLSLRPWKMAASVAVLVGLMWFIFPRSGADQLYATHFEVPSENLSVRDQSDLNANLQAGLTYYNDGNFEAAEQSFDNFILEFPNRSDVIFFRAICQMMQNKHGQARLAFDKVISDSANFRNAARWYKGLSYLHDGSHAAAKETLHHLIAQSSNRYAERAREIINKLD